MTTREDPMTMINWGVCEVCDNPIGPDDEASIELPPINEIRYFRGAWARSEATETDIRLFEIYATEVMVHGQPAGRRIIIDNDMLTADEALDLAHHLVAAAKHIKHRGLTIVPTPSEEPPTA